MTSKGHICGLIEEVAEAESIYNAGEAKFDSILASVAKEVKAFVCQEGEKQRNEYKEQSLAWIRQDHGRLDGTCFIPMIISNLTAHRALAISQRVAHSHVPLKIMSVPLCTQAGAVKVYMRFVEFLAGRVIALQERLGPNMTTVPLESETGGQSMSPMHRRSSFPSPAHKPSPPPKRGSPVSSRHGSPARTDPGKKTLGANGRQPGRLQPAIPRVPFQLWADLDLSDQDVDDTFTDEEGKDRCQTPLPAPGKRSHLSSDNEKSPSKKVKLDVSNLYGANPSTSAKGIGGHRERRWHHRGRR